jgi:DNA-binding FadR family transcriptional regulator
MLHALTTSQISIKQVLEVRTLVEVHVAQMAAKRRTKSNVVRLRATVAGMRQTAGTPDKLFYTIWNFTVSSMAPPGIRSSI